MARKPKVKPDQFEERGDIPETERTHRAAARALLRLLRNKEESRRRKEAKKVQK